MSIPTLTDLKSIASQPPENITTLFESDFMKGLRTSECSIRTQTNGPNLITTHKKLAEWKAILRHFKSPLIILLLLATAISFSVGQTFNASIIFLIVLLSVLIDYFQERQAGNAAGKLRD